MNFTVETTQTKRKILIVDRSGHPITRQLKEAFIKYDNEVFISPALPHNLDQFDSCFFVDESKKIFDKVMMHDKIRGIFLYAGNPKRTQEYNHLLRHLGIRHTKIIHLYSYEEVHDDDLEKILWFSFTTTGETLLTFHIHKKIEKKELPKAKEETFIIKKNLFRPKIIIAAVLFLVLIVHTLFLIPLGIGNYYLYKSFKNLKDNDFTGMLTNTSHAQDYINTTKSLYTFARPVLLILSLASYPDNLLQMDDSATTVMSELPVITQTSKQYIGLLLKKNKSPEEQSLLYEQQKTLTSQLDDLSQDLSYLYQKLPDMPQLKKYKEQLKDGITAIDTGRKILPHMDTIFAKGGSKKYLLMFANNMELRPGGGFIGSFGILNTHNYSIGDLRVYDVYDADGQLKAHIEPPAPIRDYLHQPHWFLRDSAFSPDFYENYKQATFFLQREMSMNDFDGGILITTTAIQNMLEATGDLYVPDFNEVVNRDNFYLKAQLYAEKGFFPGSTQKKRFLSAVMDQLIIRIEDSAGPKLFQMLEKSLDEKQIVAYFEDSKVENTMNGQYWSGRIISPSCTSSNTNCLVDYLLPYDANLGVNKANFYVSKSVKLAVSLDSSGATHNKLIMTVKNDSPSDSFPGGSYKNYMQIALPNNANVKRVTKNGVLVDKYDITNTSHQTVGFYTEIAPQAMAEITVEYQLSSRLTNGQGVYQLIVQKQIGSPNYDFNVTLSLPKNIYVVNQNFSPLVNGNTIEYNTSIKSDKIFYIELLKE